MFFLLLLQKSPAFLGLYGSVRSPVLRAVERMAAVNGANDQFVSAGLENSRLGCNRWLWWILKCAPLIAAEGDLEQLYLK